MIQSFNSAYNLTTYSPSFLTREVCFSNDKQHCILAEKPLYEAVDGVLDDGLIYEDNPRLFNSYLKAKETLEKEEQAQKTVSVDKSSDDQKFLEIYRRALLEIENEEQADIEKNEQSKNNQPWTLFSLQNLPSAAHLVNELTLMSSCTLRGNLQNCRKYLAANVAINVADKAISQEPISKTAEKSLKTIENLSWNFGISQCFQRNWKLCGFGTLGSYGIEAIRNAFENISQLMNRSENS